LLGAAIAAATDLDEGSWMLVATFLAATAVVVVPGGLRSVQQLRRTPHLYRCWALLLVVSISAGVSKASPELLAGALGCAAAGYAAALALSRYLNSRDT
jgi:hypothetical protein